MERHSRNCLAPSSGVPCCFVFVCVCAWRPGFVFVCAWRLGNTLGMWPSKLLVPQNCTGRSLHHSDAVRRPSTPLVQPLHLSGLDSRRTPPKHSCTCLVVQQRVPRAVILACSVMLNCVVTSLCAVFVVLHISRGWRLAQPARSLHALPGAHLRLLYATRHVPQATNLCCCNSMLQHYWVAD